MTFLWSQKSPGIQFTRLTKKESQKSPGIQFTRLTKKDRKTKHNKSIEIVNIVGSCKDFQT